MASRSCCAFPNIGRTAISSQSRCYDDEKDEEDHDDHDGDNNCLWWCKQAPSEVTTGKMTARCIKITADNSQPSSNDQEFLQCHQDLPIALSLSVLSNIALFSLTISLILFPGLLSMFGCFVHFLTLWSLRSQRRGQEVGEMFWVAGWRRLRHQTGSLYLLCFQASVILIRSTVLPLYLFDSFHSEPILDQQIGRNLSYHVAVAATLHSQFRKGSGVFSTSPRSQQSKNCVASG